MFIPPGSYLVGLDLGMHMVVVVVVGPLVGIVSLYLSAGLLGWAGYWLGGTSSQSGLRAALAWASVPGIVIAPAQLAGLLIYGKFIFYPSFLGNEESADMQVARAVLMVLGWGATVWATVIGVKCVSQVQRFSSWRAIASEGIAFGVLLLIGFAVVAVILVAQSSLS
jgi:hypothetical protein